VVFAPFRIAPITSIQAWLCLGVALP